MPRSHDDNNIYSRMLTAFRNQFTIMSGWVTYRRWKRSRGRAGSVCTQCGWLLQRWQATWQTPPAFDKQLTNFPESWQVVHQQNSDNWLNQEINLATRSHPLHLIVTEWMLKAARTKAATLTDQNLPACRQWRRLRNGLFCVREHNLLSALLHLLK